MNEPIHKNKVMIILWHWMELRDHQIVMDSVDIVEAPDSKIIRIDDHYYYGKEKDLSQAIFQQIEKYTLQGKVILFLHDTSFLKEYYDDLKRSITQEYDKGITLRLFGGGKSFIYYNPLTETGLLRQKSGFPNGKIWMKWKDPQTGETLRAQKNITEEDPNSDTFKIKKFNFDSVWNYYYQYLPKKKIFEFKENLLTHLVGIEAEKKFPGRKVEEIIENTPLMESHGEIINKKEWENRLYEAYGENYYSNIFSAYDQIFNQLKNKSLGPDYMDALRSKFDHMLKLMPEKIYE